MKTTPIEEHVLPRPVSRLPEYANARSRQSLADRLVDAFGLSSQSASAIANAVVDPSEVRKSIGEPTEPDYERIPVPGGTLRGIRTTVWSRRVMPDPRNPRTLPSRKHPFAVEPGAGGEDSKFRPVAEPRALDPSRPRAAELAVDIENRHQLTWASQQAASYVLRENNWQRSIESQGVMEAVWLVATTYEHSDGSDAATTLTTVEGSSRTTAVHSILNIRSADVPYDDSEQKLRGIIKRLNEAFDRGERGNEMAVELRCETMPALILVGFDPHPNGSTGFSTAVKSLVALRHVDPPKPWGEGPENEALADEVLDELYRRGRISATDRAYYAGSCTKKEAVAAHLPPDSVMRAALIVRLLSSDDDQAAEAIRVAVTSQSTRKNITSRLMNDLATALALRAIDDDPAKVDRVRRYLRYAFSKAAHREKWEATGRGTDQLVSAALEDVRQSIASGNQEEPGPSSLELAVRAAYPVVVAGGLNADRGSAGNTQPDRRNPGEVLDAMRRTSHGVIQLGQVLKDFESGLPLRVVNEVGEIQRVADGSAEQIVTDLHLRHEFPPPGKAKAPRIGDTPAEHFERALAEVSNAIELLSTSHASLRRVLGHDSMPLVDASGVEPRLTKSWRAVLNEVDDDLTVWAKTFGRRHGVATKSPLDDDYDEVDAAAEEDLYADEADQQ